MIPRTDGGSCRRQSPRVSQWTKQDGLNTRQRGTDGWRTSHTRDRLDISHVVLRMGIGIIAWASMRVLAVSFSRSVRPVRVMPDPWY